MNAQETKRRGQKYCGRHHCDLCPLKSNKLCINDEGELIIDLHSDDFIIFAERFNKLIDELYPDLVNKEKE